MTGALALLAVAGCCTGATAATIVEFSFADGNASTATNTGTLGAGTNGSISGGSITASPFSSDNQAILLGGASGNGISVPNTFDFTSAFTVEALVRLDSLGTTTNIIFDDFGGPGVLLTVDTLQPALRFGTATVADAGITVADPADFILGQWYHVAGRYDGSTVELFVNGQSVDSFSTSGAIQNHGAVTPTIGKESGGTLFEWEGAIDDFRIHDTAIPVSAFNDGNTLPVPEPRSLLLLLAGTSLVLLRRDSR